MVFSEVESVSAPTSRCTGPNVNTNLVLEIPFSGTSREKNVSNSPLHPKAVNLRTAELARILSTPPVIAATQGEYRGIYRFDGELGGVADAGRRWTD